MNFKNLFGFGKLRALGFTQEDAQGHDTSGSISVCHPHVKAVEIRLFIETATKQKIPTTMWSDSECVLKQVYDRTTRYRA